MRLLRAPLSLPHDEFQPDGCAHVADVEHPPKAHGRCDGYMTSVASEEMMVGGGQDA